MSARAESLGGSIRIISLVGAAHFMSHLYHMSLPPLFPILKAEMGVSYTALALPLTTFSLATAIGQMPVGFLVDRIGGRTVLLLGLMVQAVAIGLIGFTASYWPLLVLYTVAGLAHSVFHPADYAILSEAVHASRLGRAFGIHSVTGTAGTTLTPILMVVLTATWDWRTAFVIIGAFGLFVAMVLWTQGGVLAGDVQARTAKRKEVALSNALTQALRLLLSMPLLLFFLFYIILTMGFSGVRAFSVAALVELYEVPLTTANGALTGYMIGISTGILAGGVIADRIGPRNMTVAVCLISAAAMLMIVGSVSLPVVLIFVVLGAAGFLRGTIQSTRDLMIFSITPEGSHGKVFAFVSSGSHIGQALMPLMFGWIMDHADPAWVFWLAGLLALVALSTLIGINRARR